MGKNFYKIILIGDSLVGKTSILKTYVNNKVEKYPQSTIGVDYYRKNFLFNDKNYDFELWDTAGQERYASIINSYFRGADCVIIVYDVSNPNSFKNVEYWMEKSNTESRNEPLVVVVGNKIDLAVSQEIDLQYYADVATKNNWSHTFTSAHSKENVSSVFELFITSTIKKSSYKVDLNLDSNYHMPDIKLNSGNSQSNFSQYECC